MYTLSVVLNLHREGELALKTINNLRNSLRFANESKNWDEIEFIAVLDNSDEKTKQIISNNQDLFNKIEYVDYRDLAHSRNHGVRTARHQFVLFSDGDDFISHNSFVALYEEFYQHYSKFTIDFEHISHNDHIAVFPKLLVEFPNLFFQEYTHSNEFIIENMKFLHCFISRICAPRILLLTNPLQKNAAPYGYEDWDLNNRLLTLGVKYRVVKDYVLYYRKSNSSSMLQNQVKNKCIVRNSSLYQLDLTDQIKQQNAVIMSQLLPLETESEKVARINATLTMSLEFLAQYDEHNTKLVAGKSHNDMSFVERHYSFEVLAYKQLIAFLQNKEAVLFMSSPTLEDVDNEIKHYVKALYQREVNVCIISTLAKTECTNSTVENLILHTIQGWNEINDDLKMDILVKALINTNTLKRIYCIQSELGDSILKYYAAVLNEYNKKFTSPLGISHMSDMLEGQAVTRAC